jgi:hypothetical protein
MNKNDQNPYAILGGGALDQQLFKTKSTPPLAEGGETSDKNTNRSKAQSAIPSRQDGKIKESKSRTTDVRTLSLHDVNMRLWRDIIENTETHNSSLRLTTEESDNIEDLIKELKRKLKVKTSLNEIARLGLLYLLHDFNKNRENSLVYKVKKS